MSLIVVVEKEGSTGEKFYHFTDCDTGIQRRWIPPKGLSPAERQIGFEAIARTIELASSLVDKPKPKPAHEAIIVPDKEMPLRTFIETVFLPRKIITISENTRDRWVNTLDAHIIPHLGMYRLCDLNPIILSDYLLNLQKQRLARSTVNRHYTILKSIFKMATGFKFLVESPLAGVDRPKSRKDELATEKDPPEAFTAQEVVHIMNCLEKEPLKYQVMVRIMAETGVRRGECCAITWDSIDFDNCSILINKSLYYTKDRGIFLDTTKNKKAHIVYVSKETIELLKELQLINFIMYESDYVFTQKCSAQPIHPHTPTRYFSAFSHKYNIDHMHPHKLRHTFASIAITNGADVVSVAELLGHSNTEVLFRHYTNANVESRREASQKYREAIAKAEVATRIAC